MGANLAEAVESAGLGPAACLTPVFGWLDSEWN